MRGLRFIWRLTQVIDGTVLLFKEFMDDGSGYDEYRGNPDRGWWTGEERRIRRSEFWASREEQQHG